MEFFDVRSRKLTVLFYKCEQTFDSTVLISNKFDDVLRALITGVVRNETSIETLLNKKLGDPVVESVKTFYESCLDSLAP